MQPMTKKEAEAHRYGVCPAQQDGVAYDPDRCAEEMLDLKAAIVRYQCARKNGKGPNGLFCGRHAKQYKGG